MSDGARFCRGTSINKTEAYAKAFGELFERISLRYNTDLRTRLHSTNELQQRNENFLSYTAFP